MENKAYEIQYTRLFQEDLTSAADYVANVLSNPDAAERLINDTEQAILKRTSCAESFEPYPTTHNRKHPYFRIYVGNYTVFYVVIGNTMEVRRFLYSARNLPPQL